MLKCEPLTSRNIESNEITLSVFVFLMLHLNGGLSDGLLGVPGSVYRYSWEINPFFGTLESCCH